MVNFCKIDGSYMTCDDATIKKYNLKIERTISKEDFAKYGNDYYTENGELILGKNPKESNREELFNLKKWFDEEYAQKEQKYRRLYTLQLKTDDGKDPYIELINLYQIAENKRKLIQELETKV